MRKCVFEKEKVRLENNNCSTRESLFFSLTAFFRKIFNCIFQKDFCVWKESKQQNRNLTKNWPSMWMDNFTVFEIDSKKITE